MQALDLILIAALVGLVIYLARNLRATGTTSKSYYPALARQAGQDPDALRPYYWSAKVVFAFLLPVLLANVRHGRYGVLGFLAAIFGFMIPDIMLTIQRSRRQAKILGQLSFFLDLVVSFLRSGLTLDESVNRAANRGLVTGNPLAEEVRLVSDEMAAGKDRAQAFGALARRTAIPDLQSVAAALELGSRLGFPVADILANQADIQREKRVERGKRKMDRAMIVALFPVMLCGFPLFVLVVIVPTILEMSDTFKIVKGLLG